jgi:hypothetical protein
MMETGSLQLVSGWVWVVVGLGLHGLLLHVSLTSGVRIEAASYLMASLIALAASGLLVSALILLGLTDAARWGWRISGGLLVLVSVWMGARAEPSFVSRVAAAGNFVVAGLVAGAGMAIGSLGPPTSAGELGKRLGTVTIDGVGLWHGVALGMLGLVTAAFLILFVRALERGVTLQVESHWGGLGSGLGGWRMSSSLTYLLVATAFGMLFAVFVLWLTPGPRGTTATPAARTGEVVTPKRGPSAGPERPASKTPDPPR